MPDAKTTPRRRRAPRSSAPLAAVPDAPAETPSIADLFRKGRTIAQIARDAKVGQDAVRSALDEAGVDYSADKNAQPIAPPASKSSIDPKPKVAWTLAGSLDSIEKKPVVAGSKREKVINSLAADPSIEVVIERLYEAESSVERARLLNALNAALSAHYARV